VDGVRKLNGKVTTREDKVSGYKEKMGPGRAAYFAKDIEGRRRRAIALGEYPSPVKASTNEDR